MTGAREAATKGLHLSVAATRHIGWWLRWQTGARAHREVAELGPLPPSTAAAERPAA